MKQQLTEVSDPRMGIHWGKKEMAMDYTCQKKLREDLNCMTKARTIIGDERLKFCYSI